MCITKPEERRSTPATMPGGPRCITLWSEGDDDTAAARLETVRFLLAHGAEVNAKSKDGQTPLDVTHHEAFTPVLKGHGAKPGAPIDGAQ